MLFGLVGALFKLSNSFKLHKTASEPCVNGRKQFSGVVRLRRNLAMDPENKSLGVAQPADGPEETISAVCATSRVPRK